MTAKAPGPCSACSRTGILAYRQEAGRVCRGCYDRGRVAVCGRCGTSGHAANYRRDATDQRVCGRCRSQARATQRHASLLAEAVTLVGAVASDLDHEVIQAAVEQAAPRRGLPRLLGYLRAHPDALTSGANDTDRVVDRLIAELRAVGATTVLPPCCARCDRAVPLTRRIDGRRVCEACARAARLATCGDCGRRQPVQGRTVAGGPQCSACYARQRRVADCVGCGNRRRIAALDPEGRPRCGRCHRRDPATWEPCGGCGQARSVVTRAHDGTARCHRCYQQPLDRCGACGQLGRISSRRTGTALCESCYQQQTRRPCGRCGRVGRIVRRPTATDPELCASCYQAPMATCSRCGRHALCRRIGPGRAPVCFRCQLERRLEELLGDASGTSPTELEPLRAALLADPNPRTALGWLRRSPAVETLVALASGSLPLTHQALDQTAGGPAIEHLRQLLIAGGALPERDQHLARVQQHLAEEAASLTSLGVDPASVYALRAYGTWRVLVRLRRRAEQGKTTHVSATLARGKLTETASFLAWLHRRGQTLATCTQADLDGWTSARSNHAHKLRDFILWAIERRHLPDLQPPSRQRRDGLRPMPHADRWALARQLLHNDQVDVADRVAGLLVLLYAQPLSRITRLTIAHLHHTEGDTFVAFGPGRDQVLLPEPLASLIRQLPTRQHAGMAGRLAPDTAWLFPGGQPGQPLHPVQLGRRLNRLGLHHSSAGRTAALLQLAAELPTRVLADLLNLHLTTADRWVKAAGGNWNRYAAERSRLPASNTR